MVNCVQSILSAIEQHYLEDREALDLDIDDARDLVDMARHLLCQVGGR